MNNIQEKDWAEDDWHSHTGIDSSCDYCLTDGASGEATDGRSGQGACYPDNRADDQEFGAATRK